MVPLIKTTARSMSAMAVAAGGGVRSTLNPNAPLFIPASFQQVEDFSPEWWNLVKTSVWFRDHWISEHQGQKTFDGDDDDEDDVGDSLLPQVFLDLSISEEFSSLEEELEQVILQMEAAEQAASSASSPRKDKSEMDAADMIKSLSLKSPGNGNGNGNANGNGNGNGGMLRRPLFEPAKHREKPAQCLSPKCSPRRIIQQPR